MKLKNILEKTKQYNFKECDICDEKTLIYTLVCHVKEISMQKLYSNKNELVFSKLEEEEFFKCLERILVDKEPLQYVISEVSFFNEKYHVTKEVLIPRPDSEILVEKAIEYIEKYEYKTLLDMCTGSGALRHINYKKF
ncbi:MAG: hypothetical protein PHR25_04670 [Clostridia bacterium]|nr:hypothetical protein [Clostridia bacterium]MDD4376058.1 hypothetical protein [Clostridia bacterium]